jgi:hypothetical protein
LAGWQYGILERLAHNADIGSATSYWKKALPILDGDRSLHASSDTYRRNLCEQMWIDPDTPQSQAYVDMLPGFIQGAARVSPDNHNWYIVDSDVPKREIRNGNSAQWSSTYDGANDQWATRMHGGAHRVDHGGHADVGDLPARPELQRPHQRLPVELHDGGDPLQRDIRAGQDRD